MRHAVAYIQIEWRIHRCYAQLYKNKKIEK